MFQTILRRKKIKGERGVQIVLKEKPPNIYWLLFICTLAFFCNFIIFFSLSRGHCLAFQEIFVQCISRFCRVCSVALPKKCSCKRRVFETKKDRMSAYFHFHLALCNESTLMFRNQVLNGIESSSGEDAKIKCKNVCF